MTHRRRIGSTVVTTLDAVSLDVHRGEVVAIRAARGEGKTALVRIAAGVEPPHGGSVCVDGQDVGALSASARTRCLRRVGFVPKTWRVAGGKPLLDHVALPLLAQGAPPLTAMAKAHEAIEGVGIGACAEYAVDELTASERTRAALAQALVRDPDLLLLDEPGTMSETDEREAILRLVHAIAARRSLALVLTARDVAGVAGADRVLTLAGGRLREAVDAAGEPTAGEVLPFRTRVPTGPER